jgi:hypothetical protein
MINTNLLSNTTNRFKKVVRKQKLVVYINNTTKSNKFKTTYCGIVIENDITSYLEAHNIKKESIKMIYFNNKLYKL